MPFKVFTITDRPVYRPKQKVHYKFWIRRAHYDMRDVSYFADQAFNVEIFNPKNERIVNKQFTTDAYGGIEGELELPEDAALGVYRLQVNLLKKDRSQLVSRPAGRLFPRRGIQEAGVRGYGRSAERAGCTGRKDYGHRSGKILFRLARDRRDG